MLDKARFYIANGATLVWLIEPEKQIVEVHTAIDDYVLLPGFELSVSSIFDTVR